MEFLIVMYEREPALHYLALTACIEFTRPSVQRILPGSFKVVGLDIAIEFTYIVIILK